MSRQDAALNEEWVLIYQNGLPGRRIAELASVPSGRSGITSASRGQRIRSCGPPKDVESAGGFDFVLYRGSSTVS